MSNTNSPLDEKIVTDNDECFNQIYQPDAAPDTPAALADSYRILRLLGEGSNGRTWLARTLIGDKSVAIKSLKFSQIESLKSYELFLREAEVLASLNVHGVPHFYETVIDKSQNNEYYLVQQFIDAPSIQSYIDQGRIFSEAETLLLMRKLAEILKELETNYTPPVIHRDIKPSNILCRMPVATDDALIDLDPWLIDFGAVANPQKRQQGSTVAGTLGYMAPEQIVGDNTIQADYYALGATMLHMITGVPPYNIPSELFSLDFKPVIKDRAPNTSTPMIELLDILLNKSPDQRPSNINELIRYIENVMQGRSPKLDKTIQKRSFTQKVKSFFQKIYNYFNFSYKLVPIQGTITGISIHGINYFVEYYYTVNGDTFTNISLIQHDDYAKLSYRNIFPCPCTIKYDSQNRARSYIDMDAFKAIVAHPPKTNPPTANAPAYRARSYFNINTYTPSHADYQSQTKSLTPTRTDSKTTSSHLNSLKNTSVPIKLKNNIHFSARPRSKTR